MVVGDMTVERYGPLILLKIGPADKEVDFHKIDFHPVVKLASCVHALLIKTTGQQFAVDRKFYPP